MLKLTDDALVIAYDTWQIRGIQRMNTLASCGSTTSGSIARRLFMNFSAAACYAFRINIRTIYITAAVLSRPYRSFNFHATVGIDMWRAPALVRSGELRVLKFPSLKFNFQLFTQGIYIKRSRAIGWENSKDESRVPMAQSFKAADSSSFRGDVVVSSPYSELPKPGVWVCEY